MTSNPLLILIINMTVVFFVLFTLELLTRGIYLIDPTRKKSTPASPAVTETVSVTKSSTTEERADDLVIAAVIAAAIAAVGESYGRINVIRRLEGTSWSWMDRIGAVSTRKNM